MYNVISLIILTLNCCKVFYILVYTNLQVYLDGVVTVVDSKHALHQMR